mmetsp:Transcript_144128/g.268500  ORF Transcript_144128/g.268500 Transcript_144128/m.268500 type:complete len:495 (+) Transcript_144128:56-1540(+)
MAPKSGPRQVAAPKRRGQPQGQRVQKQIVEQTFHQPWRQYESFNPSSTEGDPWQKRADEVLQRLKLKPDDVKDLKDLDISAADARVLCDEEVIEAMIERRVRAELELENSRSAEGSDKEAEESRQSKKPVKRRKLAWKKTQERDPEEEADFQDLEEVAPIHTYDEVHKERVAKMHTEAAKLVEAASKALRNRKKQMQQGVTCTETSVNVPLPALTSYPHQQASQRVALRFESSSVAASSTSASSRGRAARGARASKRPLVDLASVPPEVKRLRPDEVILTVAVCGKNGKKDQEFDVLASQHLWELRDAFHFVSDWMFDGPTRIKSACFFIDGIFYSDQRDPTAIDYSKEIIEWVQETRDPGYLRATESRSMDMRFCDLDRLPFGERCVYIHQGDIEHNIFFTGARLSHQDDCPFVEAYPLLVFMRDYRKRRCYACLQVYAAWLVLDSSRCPHNPVFLCQNCFRMFYQDSNKDFVQPVDYKVFPYLHDDPDNENT